MSVRKRRIGLIVNPVAGIGGRVGLKGSDGQDIVRKAMELGAEKRSPDRAVAALRRLESLKDRIELITAAREMGEDEAKEAGFEPEVIESFTPRGETSSEDTVEAARAMMENGVELIVFAGGDGTARDVYRAVGDRVPTVGIPSGVKMHSGVYAVNPRSAGDLVAMYVENDNTPLREAEVMDIDEDAFRENRVSARLYGYLRIPYEQTLVQSAKSGSPASEEDLTDAIAGYIVDNLEKGTLYIVGPGTTTRPILAKLGLEKTLLGVDIIEDGKLVAADVGERDILKLVKGRSAKIIITVIGGQGFVFGRGSQQISPEVIRTVGAENIIIIASPGKLASLGGKPLLVDTGDTEVDEMLSGFHKIVTGYGRRAAYKVKSG